MVMSARRNDSTEVKEPKNRGLELKLKIIPGVRKCKKFPKRDIPCLDEPITSVSINFYIV